MKLLSKTTLLILTVSIFIFMVGNIVFFQATKSMIKKHIDYELVSQMHNVIKQIKENESMFQITRFSDEVKIESVDKDYKIQPFFSDTVLYSLIQKRYDPHRSLTFNYKSQSRNQRITIYKSLLSSDKLIERITLASIALVMSFIFMIFILNRYVFANVWSDFFTSIKKIDKHDIKSQKKIEFNQSEIEEFDKLNEVLSSMVLRIQKDYLNLKELTANTSHEIQTPLAIIKSKAELLLQAENLTEKQLKEIYSILNTTERLSKLNQSLLLITKIENNQFEESQIVNIKEILQKHIENFQMLFESSNTKLNTDISEGSVKINPVLFDILITNLLKNAIIHGQSKGDISIIFTKNILQISNYGETLSFHPDLIFTRFAKGANKQNSNGLGLEIVKKICDYYSIPINYSFFNEKHCFEINFKDIITD